MIEGENQNAHVVTRARYILAMATRITPTGFRPGQIVDGTNGRKYQVQADGSWRRVDAEPTMQGKDPSAYHVRSGYAPKGRGRR